MNTQDNRNSEKWLERVLIEFVDERGGAAIKIAASTVNGLPDRLILWRGGAVEFVELKSTGCKQTSVQRAVSMVLLGMGFRCTVIDSEEKLKQWQNSVPGLTRPK